MKIKSLRFKLYLSFLLAILISSGFTALLLNAGFGWHSLVIGLIFAWALALILGLILSAYVVKPLDRIIYSARKFSKGDFTHKILLNSKDEIGELALVLNEMTHETENKINSLEIRNQHLGAILQSMVEGIIVLDRSSSILSINGPIERIFNIAEKNVQNKLFLEAIPNSDMADLISDVLKTGEFKSKEISLTWPMQKIFRVNASAIFEKKLISGCVVVIHDITEVRKLDIMRRDFIANISHELKTPLTSIRGFVETLLEGALDDKENARHFLDIISSHTHRLDSLIGDLLSLSYLESEKIYLDKAEINIKGLVDDIIAGFNSQLRKKMLLAKNALPEHLIIRADRNKLDQLFTNLIDNAVKFNKENGAINIYCEEINGNIKFLVEDTGMGIPQKDLTRIFERFYRVDKARSRGLTEGGYPGGTGLGLSIVKHIAELHGGTVGAQSTEGLGSKFWFILPKQ